MTPPANSATTTCCGMPPADKPRHRSGYTAEDTLQVHSACLTVAVTLGAYLEDLCVVGGLVPSLLIDQRTAANEGAAGHPGTNDLDIALAIALLDEQRYAEIGHRLRQEGFGPDKNAKGNPAVQRWRLGDLKVTIDFLMAPLPGDDDRRVKFLESDFGAVVTPGVELAFDERILVELDGHTLAGEKVLRTIPVCGPAAFTVLKALAFADRAEPKDAYDLVYVLRGTSNASQAIADRLALHAAGNPDVVERALSFLQRDFITPEAIGPQRAATFEIVDPDDLDAAAADAHGHVDDLLTSCRYHGLIP
jgi:Nucleotidyl transferase AbiEii toxin, Type IV TA system